MKSKNNNVPKLPVLIVYVIVFYSIWTMWEFWGKMFLFIHFPIWKFTYSSE